MKVAITGALGHVGSLLIRGLPSAFPGMDIIMLDNLATQRYPSLFDLPTSARYRFVECDVTEAELALHFDGAYAVIHLAALTDAAGSFGRREQVERVNLTATKRVAEACHASGARLILPSSTSVYGTQNAVVDEDCSTDELKPQSPYAETKLREEACAAEWFARGLKCAVLRLGTIFGTSPGMRFHTAINKFCWQAVMGTPLTVWRTAYDQRRPYLDLADAVAAMAFFLEHDRFDGCIYNVVTQNASVREVVEYIRKLVPQLDVKFVEEAIMNQLSYDVSNKRMNDLGFKFSGSMEKGIGDTVALLKQSHSF